jgi:hypothetical protein
MKGAIAVPPEKAISPPNNMQIRMIGNNQNFFRSFRNPHKSIKNSITILILLKWAFNILFTEKVISFRHD